MPAAITTLPAPKRLDLGTFRMNWSVEECESRWSTDRFRTGDTIGARAGYDTMKSAIADLGRRTHDRDNWGHEPAVPAVAIVERDGRYFGTVLETKVLKGYDHQRERFANGMWQPISGEYSSSLDLHELRPVDRNARLKAIVDGDYLHRFRNTAKQ